MLYREQHSCTISIQRRICRCPCLHHCILVSFDHVKQKTLHLYFPWRWLHKRWVSRGAQKKSQFSSSPFVCLFLCLLVGWLVFCLFVGCFLGGPERWLISPQILVDDFFWERRCCCWWGVGGKVGRVKWLVFSVANGIVLVPSTKHPKHLVVIFWMYSQDHHSYIWQHLILPSFQRVNLRLAFPWQTLEISGRYIDIPEPVREVLDLWRPSPLYRATRWGRWLWWQSFHPRNPVFFSPPN